MAAVRSSTRFALRGVSKPCPPAAVRAEGVRLSWLSHVPACKLTQRALDNLSWESNTWPEKHTVDDLHFATGIALKLLRLWHGPEERNGYATPQGYRAIVEIAIEYMCDRDSVDMDMVRYVCRNGKLGRGPQ